MDTASTLPVLEINRRDFSTMPTMQECKAKTWQRVSPEFRTPNQSLGQRIAIGCVSLEITQRCNLDCTLCYLSDMSEKTLDVPMEELKRRVEEIRYHYGPSTGVQVSGGDPTLRKEEELIEIVRYISELGMQPALLTNGIKATRELLTKLAAAGLMDVAFHVDMTQQLRRPDKTYYQSEEELNVIRQEYIKRARGLGIAVIFNTTLFPGNFHELPMLVNFFKDNADVVGMCSFQLGADTGRGAHRGRDEQAIEPRNIIRLINQSLNANINFDAIDIGHPECNRIGYALVSNKRAYDLWWDPSIINKIAKGFEGITLDRGDTKKAIVTAVKHIVKQPRLLMEGLRFVAVQAWRMKWSLLGSGFKAYKLSFFIHNFMHADSLDQCRIENCSFMVMTPDGPVSMCAHNAVRNEYITKEVTYKAADGTERTFNPVREQFRTDWERRKAEGSTAPVIPERRKRAGKTAPVEVLNKNE
jgi:uncharacterized radical SAM superfamily Fe-S cluster-containing enzyme